MNFFPTTPTCRYRDSSHPLVRHVLDTEGHAGLHLRLGGLQWLRTINRAGRWCLEDGGRDLVSVSCLHKLHGNRWHSVDGQRLEAAAACDISPVRAVPGPLVSAIVYQIFRVPIWIMWRKFRPSGVKMSSHYATFDKTMNINMKTYQSNRAHALYNNEFLH